jgi:hypothetical protein
MFGFIDSIVEMYFKKDDEGKTVFYPYGHRKGYILPNEECEQHVRGFVSSWIKTFFISLPVLFSIKSLLDINFLHESIIAIVVILVFTFIWEFSIRILTRDFAVSDTILSKEEAKARYKAMEINRIKTMGRKTFWGWNSFLFLTDFFFVLMSLYLIIMAPGMTKLAGIGMLFFAGVALWIVIKNVRIRTDKSAPETK